MELSGSVRMRYDPDRRAAIMAWLAEQDVDVTNIPRLQKHSPTLEASEGRTLLTFCLATALMSAHSLQHLYQLASQNCNPPSLSGNTSDQRKFCVCNLVTVLEKL